VTRRRTTLGLAGTLVLPMLAACAQLAPPAPADRSLIAGRLSVQVAARGADPARAFSGQFELRGDAQAGALDISGPLGATVVRAWWSAGHYQLDDGQRTREFASLDALAQEALGEALPLAALFDWLRLRPWPGARHTPRADGQPGFEQLGWIIDTHEAAEGLLLAQRPAAPAVSLRVRLDREMAS
jgi:outer membrane lipoprotein LolB